MKRKNFKSVLREKGFYISLLTGAVSVVAIAAICLNVFSDKSSNKNLTDLNQTKQEQVNQGTNTTGNSQANVANNDAAVNDSTDVDSKNVVNEPSDTKEVKDNKNTADEKKSVSVSGSENKVSKLRFDQEKGLLWPVNGDVILKYSDESSIYFQTLAQYRTNPAIIISSPVGTKVKSAYNCLVKNISKSSETGVTVTTSIGSNFNVVYGQLENLKVKVGDELKEGQEIGSIAKPTKYYAVEGSNLYLKVLEKDKPVNPMLLLR